jgi:hypothetical protein
MAIDFLGELLIYKNVLLIKILMNKYNLNI